MLALIELLIIAQIHQNKQDKQAMFNIIKKALHWLDAQSNISAPSYTCEAALLLGMA